MRERVRRLLNRCRLGCRHESERKNDYIELPHVIIISIGDDGLSVLFLKSQFFGQYSIVRLHNVLNELLAIMIHVLQRVPLKNDVLRDRYCFTPTLFL